MDEKFKHFVQVNQRFSENNSEDGACEQYWDLPVCTQTSNDIKCSGELYRGCHPNSVDCADCNTGNDRADDKCCFGHLPVEGDNIDHWICNVMDAPTGGISLCTSWFDDGTCGVFETSFYKPEEPETEC